jgi:iron(III) transport system permease protein
VNDRHHAARTLWHTTPMVILLSTAALPIAFVISRFAVRPEVDVSSLHQALVFAVLGAAVATLIGGTLGGLAGTLEIPGRRWLVALSAALLAAPPAFWWIGFTRAGVTTSTVSGLVAGAAVAGLMLAPISLLLALAATREIPANAFEAARVSLGPARRVWSVLIPLLRPALGSGFLMTAIILLGESEIPFLFGFRTSMTDVVTRFSQTFDVGAAVPTVVPLLGAVLTAGLLAIRPLFALLLPHSRGGRGINRKRATAAASTAMYLLPGIAGLSLSGYARAALSAPPLWRRLPVDGSTLVSSIAEPVLCAWVAVALGVAAALPVRRSAAVRGLAMAGLLVFAIPAALMGIGWIALGEAFAAPRVPPAFAFVSRVIGLPVVAFLGAYARLPASLEDAARLVAISPWRRAWTFVLPLVGPSLVAASALIAALTFADRDVSSMLLQPGESRLMLNLYLASANAPAAVIGSMGLVVFAAGGAAIALSVVGPSAVWFRRQ